jgi:hypothetical protein
MVSYEHLRDVQPEPATYTVPTLLMRQGNFSEWSELIYDPRTATGTNNQRTPFAGNVIPADRINPVAANYLKYYPEPNQAGREDNYFSNQLRPYDYNAVLGRIDHSFGANRRLFLSGYYNKRQEDRYNWAKGAANATGEGEIGGFLVTQGFDNRSNTGAILGFTSTLSSSRVFDLRMSYTKFGEWRLPADDFDPASMGFSSNTAALFGDYDYLPFFTFGGFSTTNSGSRIATLGSQRSDWSAGFDRPFKNLALVPTLSQLWGDHSLRAGLRSCATGAGTSRRLLWRRPLLLPGHLHARQQLGAAGRAGTGVGAVPARPADDGHQHGGGPRQQREPVRDRGADRLPADLARPVHQDDWRSARGWLNLGVRLEIEKPMTEANARISPATTRPRPTRSRRRPRPLRGEPDPGDPGEPVQRQGRRALRGRRLATTPWSSCCRARHSPTS